MFNPFSALRKLLLQRVWYVHETTMLTVEATPAACLAAMAIAAKPSVNRLQLRDVFADGRRYYIEPREQGFPYAMQQQPSLALSWALKKVTLLSGTFERVGEATRLRLQAHIAIPYLVDVFLLPLMVALIIMPFDAWYMWFRMAVVAVLIALSWGNHRANAQLQAVDMVYFVGRALEDFVPTTVFALSANTPYVADDTMHREFRQEWDKFYKEHEGD